MKDVIEDRYVVASRREKILSSYPYYRSLGGLKEHWYPICFVRSLRPFRPVRYHVLGVPLYVHRDDQSEYKVFLDVCPHRQAPLTCGHSEKEGIRCPYHGWRFDWEGHCVEIPSSPEEKKTPQLHLLPFESQCVDGMLWVWMGLGETKGGPSRCIEGKDEQAGWKTIQREYVMKANVEDIVENFMDSPHTGVVHKGLIRGHHAPEKRRVHVSVDGEQLFVEHEPIHEDVGLFGRLIRRPDEKTQHRDTFLMPTHVRVEYWFGKQDVSFFAFIAMTPNAEDETKIMLTIGLRFGWMLNQMGSLILPYFMDKVVAQDDEILSLQRDNVSLVDERHVASISSDVMDLQMRRMRKMCQDCVDTSGHSYSKTLDIYL